ASSCPPPPGGRGLRRAQRRHHGRRAIRERRGARPRRGVVAVDGVDMVLLGVNDLLADWGIPGEYDHPRVREAYAKTIAACRKRGKHCGVGGLATRPDLVAEFVKMGARYVSTGTDLAFLLSACAARAKAVREVKLCCRRRLPSKRPASMSRPARPTRLPDGCSLPMACRMRTRRPSPPASSARICAASTPTGFAACRATSTAFGAA